MRKILVFLLALALLCASASALEGTGYPAWDGVSPAEDAACGSFDGQSLRLEFDPSPDYSLMEGGLAQLCFFAQDAGQQRYLELYLMLPDNLQAGDVVSEKSQLNLGCSITLYEVLPNGEDCYYAGQYYGMAYPENSGFELKIEEAGTADGTFSLKGSMNAVLGQLLGDFSTGKTIRLENIAFDCSLPVSDAASASPFGANPFEAAPDLAPKFTLPPDYITL